jgi:light-independent protochlorophyllide reductase B subunit
VRVAGLLKSAAKIPRATCQLFGAIKAISNIRDSVILVHGPKGCVYHINYILGMRGDKTSNVYSTCMDEKDVIFGAGDKLKSAIIELDNEFDPALIAVLSCCASSIIGEDVESVVKDVQTRAKILGIDAGGFEGDYRSGYSETLRRLVEVLVEPSHTREKLSVNLIGLLRAGPDLRELKRVLALIGVHVNAVLTAGATIRQIEHTASAALNVVLCEATGKDAAEQLEKQFGMPYIIEELPIGYEATLRFLARVADALGLSMNLEAISPKHRIEAPQMIGKRVAVMGGPTRAISVTKFLKEYGVEPVLVVSDFDVNTAERLSGIISDRCEVLIAPEHELILERCKAQHVDLILGGMLERPIASRLGVAHLDIMHGSEKTVGFAGADALLKRLKGEEQT